MTRYSSREKILDAAEAVVLKEGAFHLTLDAVAAEAGVSKGGLLYNFPNKEALLRAIVERLCRRFDAAVHAGLPYSSDPATSLCRYITASIDRGDKQDRMASGLLAVVAHSPELLGPMRAQHRSLIKELQGLGPRFAAGAVVWLAAQGLWLLELFRVLELKPEDRDLIRAEVLRRAHELSTPPKRRLPRADKTKQSAERRKR